MPYRELAGVLNQLAGTSRLETAGAANAYAGTTNLELVHALNVKAGITVPPFLEFAGACNKIANTNGLGGGRCMRCTTHSAR